MNRIRVLLFLVPALAFASSTTSDTPEGTVKALYQAFIQPEPKLKGLSYHERVEPLIGLELSRALRAQAKYEQACARMAPPDSKPYMLDQNPFFLWPDGAKKLVSTRRTGNSSYAKVATRLAYDDTIWTDTAILKHESGKWVVVDVTWEGGDSLTKRLIEFARHPCEPMD